MSLVTMEWESRLGRRLRVRDLFILSTVVKSGSMAKAARALAMTQPAVSEAIANLEHILRVRLLDRGPRGTAPTVYAEALLKRSMTVFDELRQSVRDIEFLSASTTGELTIGYTDIIAAVFPKIVERFSEKFPRVLIHVDIVQPPILKSLPLLRDRTFDLLLARSQRPTLDRLWDDMDTEVLLEDPLVVVTGAESRWASRRKIDLAELLEERWILSPTNGLSYELVAAAFKAQGLGVPAVSMMTNTLDLRLKLLVGGQFISVVPISALRGADGHRLKQLPIKMPVARGRAIAIFKLKNRTLSPVVERFIECARAVAKSLAHG
jgi:DNA-binding transcriptional LysR family regulator